MRFNFLLSIFTTLTGSFMFHLGMTIGEFIYIRHPTDSTTALHFRDEPEDFTHEKIKNLVRVSRWTHFTIMLVVLFSETYARRFYSKTNEETSQALGGKAKLEQKVGCLARFEP